MRGFFRYLISGGILLVYCGCSDNNVAGGTGTDTGPVVTGIINDDTGPAQGVVVTLYPDGFNPVAESVPDSTRKITNDSGRYTFAIPEPGKYNIQAIRPEDNTVHLIQNTEITGEESHDVTPTPGKLEQAANVTIHLDSLDLHEDGYLYVPGTGISTRVTEEDLEAGFVTLSSVPPAAYDEVNYAAPDNAEETNVLEEKLEVAPGEDASIGPFDDWQDTTMVTINTTASGAGINENIYQVPVLIRLNNSVPGAESVFAGTFNNGTDLRVTKSDGVTLLPYEIERWDSPNRLAEVWVHVDTVYGNNSTQHIMMYTGNPLSVSLSSGTDVFSHEFSAVWHMNEKGNSDTLGYLDATANGNHATGVHLGSGDDVECIIARCPELDGDNDYLTVEDDNSLDVGSDFTISLWVLHSDTITVNWPRMIDKKSNWKNSSGWTLQGSHLLKNRVTLIGSDSIHQARIEHESINWLENQWEHIAVIVQDSTVVPVVNGVALPALVIAPVRDTDTPVYIGQYPDGGLHHWTGNLDEIRISNTLRSVAWVKFNYENQKEGSTVISIGN